MKRDTAKRDTAKRRAFVGVSDHGGWAVLVTATHDGALVDRRRVELVDADLPKLPHHHEGQHLPMVEAVALVARVRASAETNARARLDTLAREIDAAIDGIALRAHPPLPPTVEERIRDYRAMCVADWVMYREALADAARARGWRVHAYDAKRVLELAATEVARAGAAAGRPWTKDHRLAMSAAIAACRAARA